MYHLINSPDERIGVELFSISKTTKLLHSTPYFRGVIVVKKVLI